LVGRLSVCWGRPPTSRRRACAETVCNSAGQPETPRSAVVPEVGYRPVTPWPGECSASAPTADRFGETQPRTSPGTKRRCCCRCRWVTRGCPGHGDDQMQTDNILTESRCCSPRPASQVPEPLSMKGASCCIPTSMTATNAAWLSTGFAANGQSNPFSAGHLGSEARATAIVPALPVRRKKLFALAKVSTRRPHLPGAGSPGVPRSAGTASMQSTSRATRLWTRTSACAARDAARLWRSEHSTLPIQGFMAHGGGWSGLSVRVLKPDSM